MSSLDSTSFTTQQLRRGLVLLGAIVLLRAVLVGTFWAQPDRADPFGFGLLVLVAFLVGSVGIIYVGLTRWVGVDLKAWWIDPEELRGDLLWGVAGLVVVFVVIGVFGVVMMFGLGLEPPEQVPPSAVGFALMLVFGFAVRAFQEETLFRGFLQTAFENRTDRLSLAEPLVIEHRNDNALYEVTPRIVDEYHRLVFDGRIGVGPPEDA